MVAVKVEQYQESQRPAIIPKWARVRKSRDTSKVSLRRLPRLRLKWLVSVTVPSYPDPELVEFFRVLGRH